MSSQKQGPKHVRADVGRAQRGRAFLAAAAASLVALAGMTWTGVAVASDEDQTPTPSATASTLQTDAAEEATSDQTQGTDEAVGGSSETADGSSSSSEYSESVGTTATTVDPEVTATPESDTATPSKASTSIQTRDVQIQQSVAGPETGVATPYVYWTVKDSAGNLVGGATFTLQGPRSRYWNWGTTYTVTDCISSLCSGLDRDPDPGEFQVNLYTALQSGSGISTSTDSRRFQLKMTQAPSGFRILTTDTKDNGSGNNNGSTGWSSSNTYNFGNFEVAAATNTIVVQKGSVRTGTTNPSGVNTTSTVGVRFGLFDSQTSTGPLYTCEVTTADGKCTFTGVAVAGRTLWVGELDPAPGTAAASAFTGPLTSFSTGTSNEGFVVRPYRYETPTMAGTGQTYTVPTANDRGWGSQWGDSSGYFANRAVNPKLTQTCSAGVKVAVVLDTSGSVGGNQDNLAKATTALVNGLTGTPSSVAMFSFAASTPGGVTNHPTLQSVQTPAGANTVKGWYSESGSNGQIANFTPADGTNWDLGLWTAALGASSNDYDIVFVLTDGNPTYSQNGSGRYGTDGTGSLTTFRELERAVFSANAIKATGARVMTIGIGDGLSSDNLASISGPAAYASGASLNDFDYISADWTQLEQVLKDFAQGLKCQATVTVEKQAQHYGGSLAAASGWNFGLSQTGAAQQTPQDASQATGSNGQATWTLTFENPADEASVTLTELEDRTGWSLTGITCDVGDVAVDLANKNVSLSGIGIGENVKCTFTNVESQVGALAITKKFDDSVPSGTSGSFSGTYTCTLKNATVASGTWSTQGQGDATLTAAQDSPAPPTKIPAGASCSVMETAASGGLPNGSWVWGTATISGPVNIESGATSTVTVTNTTNRVLGSVTWTKVDQGNNLLPGSEWMLTGPDTASGGTPVTDCTASPCGNEPFDDQNPAVGGFKLTGLSWGDYTLVESKAPVGYVLDPAEHKFSIGQTSPAMLDNALGAIQNVPVTTPNLPLTGGLGTDTFLLAGGGLLALAGIGGWIHRRRSLRVQRA